MPKKTRQSKEMQPKSHIRFDWAIKRLLKQKANFEILEGFLSELLREDIKIIEILDSESNKETEEDKFNRVDILVKDQRGDLIIIEVQNTYGLDYFQRILYGISKAITEHIKESDPYRKVKKVISVNIIYFDLGQGSDYIYKGSTQFFGLHDQQLLELTPSQQQLFQRKKVSDLYPEIYLIKVNNFDDIARDTLDEWVYFLKNSEIKKEFSAKGLKKAEEVLNIANMEYTERRAYQRFMEVLSDRASAAMTIKFEIQLGIEKGVEEAMEQLEHKMQKVLEEKMQEEKKVLEKKMQQEKKVLEERIAEETTMKTVKKLIDLQLMSDEQIAAALDVSINLVRKIRAGN